MSSNEKAQRVSGKVKTHIGDLTVQIIDLQDTLEEMKIETDSLKKRLSDYETEATE